MVTASLYKPVRGTLHAALLVGTVMLACAAAGGTAWGGPMTETAYLNQISASNIGTGSQGTVTLTQNGSNEVDVMVSLTSGVTLINSGGPHTPFVFNLDSAVAATSTVVNISPGAFFLPTPAPPGSYGETPYGSFNFSIFYTGQNGGGHGNAGPLTFAVENAGGISISDFVQNGSGYLFAADVLGTGGNTGGVAADPVTPSDVPEPSSLALLGTGLIGLGLVGRRKRHCT